MLRLKQLIVNSPLSHLAHRLRDRYSLMRAAVARPESVGTLANDHLAAELVTRLPCRVFVDCGAHLGVVAAAVHRQNPEATIIICEAVPEKAEALVRSCPFATVHSCAVGAAEGQTSFFVDRRRPAYSSLLNHADCREITVPMHTLDDLVQAADVVKIDVEGAELSVLQGAQRLLRESRPTVMYESGPLGSADDKPHVWALLTEFGYQIVVPNRLAHHDDGLDLAGFLEAHRYPRRTTNYFAVPQEKREQIREMSRRILGLDVGSDRTGH